MNKRLNLFWGICLLPVLAYAQEDIKLNRDAVKQIDFGTFAGEQVKAEDNPSLNFDTTLPKVFPEKKEIRLSLRPYTANTKYNYDPIYQKKIKVDADTWKYGEKVRMKIALVATNRAQSLFSGDFMAPFTKEFWDKKARKRRARTLEVLRSYGDSITTQIRESIHPLPTD